MKTLTLAILLSAAITGAYAQTNPSDGTLTPNNDGTNGSNKNNTVVPPNNGGSNNTNTVIPKNGGSDNMPIDTTTSPNSNGTPNIHPTDKKKSSTHPPIGL